MNCQETQLQLSGYMEKSLDTIRMKSIESHLSSCPFCRAELHGLSDCIKLVADLAHVDPPAGFTQRVMAHAREIEPEPHSWRRFFMALKVTVPVQAAALVLISVLAVLLYQKEPRVNDLAFLEKSPPALVPSQDEQQKAPVPENIPVEAREDAARDSEPQTNAVPQPVPQPLVKARQQPGARVSMKDETASPQSAPAPEPEKAMEKAIEGRTTAFRRRPIQAQEVSTGSDSPRPRADALGIGAAIGALSRSPLGASPFNAERALSPLSEPSPDFEFIVKRRTSERAEALRKRSEAASVATSGSAHFAGSPARSPVVEIRWFTVAPEHYELFKRELAAEAIIDSEKSHAAKESDFGLAGPRELLIKVMIVPPER
jgi:hypothetical protein